MSLINNLKGGGRHGIPSAESRDPMGYLLAGLSRFAQSELLDRVGLRKQTEQAVFTTTSNGFKVVAAAGRQFKKTGSKGKQGKRAPGASSDGV
ncbi:MAG: acyl-CoA dehydrogenase family protein, partial [Nocardioides sp.]